MVCWFVRTLGWRFGAETVFPAKKRLIVLLVVAAVGLVVSPLAPAAPEPALVPPDGAWQLEIELHGDLQQTIVKLPGSDEAKSYWYLLYTITNNTGQDVVFYPQFELMTDTFRLHRSGVNVRRPVFEAIRELYDRTIPLLEPESMITGQAGPGQAKGILQGQDNARDSVAIFQDYDPNATKIRVFIAGLSNETVTVELLSRPAAEEPGVKTAQKVLLRKTLMLEYQIVGDAYNPQGRVALYRNRKWVMR